MSTWGIGDIHGCYAELMKLYFKLLREGLNPDKDVVVFMGDYIDRGPDSKTVVSQMIEWHNKYPHWVFLFGNHEDIFLNWYYNKNVYQEDSGWSCFLSNGGIETLKSYETTKYDKKFPEDHIKFFTEVAILFYETDNYIFVHGGLIPGTPINDIKALINETILKALIWAREEFIDDDYDWGKFVIFGHSAAYKRRWGELGMPIMMKNKCGIDGAVCPPASKNLLAIELPEKKIHGIKAGSLEYFALDYNITRLYNNHI